jgi:hypothetical protein
LVGYVVQDFGVTVKAMGAAVVLSTVVRCIKARHSQTKVTVPDWPFFNKNGITWLSPVDDSNISNDEKKKSKKKGKSN